MARVRSGGPSPVSARLFIEQAASRHVRDRAKQLADTAKSLHKIAPRGGPGINTFGERRSPAAGGTAPAIEFGGLFASIDQGITQKGLEAQVVVNFGFGPGKGSMEEGTRRMRPRPLGKLALAEFEQKVRSEQ